MSKGKSIINPILGGVKYVVIYGIGKWGPKLKKWSNFGPITVK